jgi:hypothetical protein
MSALERAKKKWARKTAGKGTLWKERAEATTELACKNMAKFLGKSPDEISEWCAAQREGIAAVSPEEFAAAVEGKAEKWARGMKAIR